MLALYYFYIQKTKHGYEIKVIGDSMETARYAGINASKVMIRTMFLSAALCGLAGFLQVAGAEEHYQNQQPEESDLQRLWLHGWQI